MSNQNSAHHSSHRLWMLTAAFAALSACSTQDGIGDDGAVFDGISAEAEITLVGNEPFWGMTIAPEGMGYLATVTSPEQPDGVATPVTRFAGNNGLGFSGAMGDLSVQIALTPGACSDTMSDAVYPYTATVSLGEDTLFGCAFTSDEPAQSTLND